MSTYKELEERIEKLEKDAGQRNQLQEGHKGILIEMHRRFDAIERTTQLNYLTMLERFVSLENRLIEQEDKTSSRFDQLEMLIRQLNSH